MVQVQAGDLEAFEVLVERYENTVYGLARSLLRSPEDAEEAAQDTFMKVFRARHTFDPSRQLEPWLLRIAGNACRDRLRRRRAARLPQMTDREGESLLHLVEDLTASEAQGRAAMDQLVRAELDKLSVEVRQPLELKYMVGLTNRQIAQALGVSLSNAKVRLARAKDLLQRRLSRVLEG